jgi:hypothetical protein
MTYRDDEAEARAAAMIGELEQHEAALQKDSAALDKAARAQWVTGLATLKRPWVAFTLLLAFGCGVMLGSEIGLKRKLTVDFCPPGTPLPEGLR